MKTQGENGHLQAEEGGLRGNHPPPPRTRRHLSAEATQSEPPCFSSSAQTDTGPQARSGRPLKATLSRDLRGHLARVKFVSRKTPITAGQQGCSGNELPVKPGFRVVRVLTGAGREAALICHPSGPEEGLASRGGGSDPTSGKHVRPAQVPSS